MTEALGIVRRYLDAFGASDIEAAMACVHPEAVWRVDGDPIVGTVGIRRGHDAVRRWLVDFPSQFRPLAFTIERLMGDGPDVLALGSFRHRVVTTGAIVDSQYSIRFTVRDGLIGRYQIFEDSLLIARAFEVADPARSAVINGVGYGWDDVGSGPAILFLHGLFLDRAFFERQVAALGERYRCISFDMPGHGVSGWRDGLDHEGMAGDIALWIEEYVPTGVTIVGHSQGGMIGMRIASHCPGLVERLVLVNTSARAEYPDRLEAWKALRRQLLDGDEQRASALGGVQRRTTSAGWLAGNVAIADAEHVRMMRNDPELITLAMDAAVFNRPDLRRLIPTIRCPVSVLSGALDDATPPSLGQEIATLGAFADAIVVEDAAHHLPAEAPDVLVEAIQSEAEGGPA